MPNQTTPRRFEFNGGNSHKFWAVWITDESVVHVNYGRIGNAGQHQIKDCGTRWGAQDYMEDKIREKLGKGYVETGVVALGGGRWSPWAPPSPRK